MPYYCGYAVEKLLLLLLRLLLLLHLLLVVIFHNFSSHFTVMNYLMKNWKEEVIALRV